MGTVWAGRDELLQRDVAVKEVVPPVALDDPLRAQAGERTMREARAAARILSRSAVTVFDVVEQDGRPWIVMELLSGRTLDDVLREQGPLPPAVVARIGLGVLDALNAAHEVGILHRDVKPANVMFRDADDLSSVVLSDFGIAHFDGDTALTQTGILLGSPAYLAPERARGDVAGPPSDLWALGVTLFAAVEGVSPFLRHGPLESLNAVMADELPPYEHAGPLIPVLNGLLERDPARRMDVITARVLLTEIVERAQPAPASTVPMTAPPSPTLAAPNSGPLPPATPPRGPVTPPSGPWATATTPPAGPRRASGPETGPDGRPLAARAGYRQAPARPAGPSGPAGGPPGSGTAAMPAPRRPEGSRGPRTLLLGAVALVLAGALVAVPLIMRGRNDPGGKPSQASNGQAAQAATKTKQCEPAADGLPKGSYAYKGPGGFDIAVPIGWGWRRKSGDIYLSPKGDSGRSVKIEATKDPKADPYQDWVAQEKSAAQQIDGYKKISVEPLDCDGVKAADWEFTSDDGHVLNRNLLFSDSQGYVLTLSSPEDSWEKDLATFTTMAATFKPGT